MLEIHIVSSLRKSVLLGGVDLGGGGRPPPLRDSTPCRPKGSHFDTFSEIHFWPTDPKNFSKGAFGANIYKL